MTKRIAGVAVLCVLAAVALSAVGMATASAAQRADVCVDVELGLFKDAHCTTGVARGTYEKQNKITNGVATPITGTNEKTASETSAAAPSKLNGTLAGVETEVACSSVSGTGSLTNSATSVSGTGTITYSGCAVTKPSGQGCAVTGGTITTETLAATTESLSTNEVKFKPNSGTKFASVPISGCSTTSLNNTFPVTGSLIATATGATLTTTKVGIEGQNTLKFGGNKAGLDGALTISDSEGGIVLE
jgi:cell division septation protein DedD